MDRIAKELGAERKGKVAASGGYFGAMQLVADIEARLRVPAGGGRRTDPQWTERRLIPVAVRTLERLEKLTARVREHAGMNIEPMQLAALLLKKTTEQLSKDDAEKLLASRRRTSRCGRQDNDPTRDLTPRSMVRALQKLAAASASTRDECVQCKSFQR